MTDPIFNKKQRIGEELEETVENAQELAEELGLGPRDTKYWVVDNDEMNELAAYGGFQERYSHWRWGEKYDRQQKKDEYVGGRIFELVINDTPCHAYLQMNNSMADQKAVITHVEAHSDFFANNQWYQDEPDASDMLARHAEKIQEYMEDPDIERAEVEKWIDHVLCLEDNIDQYSEYVYRNHESDDEEEEEEVDPLERLGVSDEIEGAVFGEEWKEWRNAEDLKHYLEETESDILKYLIQNGKQYDEDAGRAEEFEDWQIDILDMLREEAYYFAPQKMTKVMNEGWAAFWESLMMTDEEFVDDSEIIDYADHMSLVLGSQGFNPYKLGFEMWKHIENTVNRREVVDKLLRIRGVTPENFHDEIDFQQVHEELDERDSYVPEKRHYSLTRPQNQGFIQEVSRSDLNRMNRYIIEGERYGSVTEAVSEVDYSKGWDEMRAIRETHNDVMFLDEFLTQDFVDDQEYFTYEYRALYEESQIASRNVEDVRKKLLLQFTNFGKPTIEVGSGNFRNSGELLLLHRYNGVMLDAQKAEAVLERMFEMWGRPVNLATVDKHVTDKELDYAYTEQVEPEPEEKEILIRYDGENFETEVPEIGIRSRLQADEMDYDTKPEEWL